MKSGMSQLSGYSVPGSIADKHTVYEYRKSNWDGTHASSIFHHIAGNNQLESFKNREGEGVATLVSATIDWEKNSVSHFQNHRLRRGKEPELIATLKMTEDKNRSR